MLRLPSLEWFICMFRFLFLALLLCVLSFHCSSVFAQVMAAYYSLASVSTHGIVFLVPLYLIFFCLTVVFILNTLEYHVNVSGPFEFWIKLVLLCLISLSLGGLVCLKLWRFFRWMLCVCAFHLDFCGLHFSPNLIQARKGLL